MERAVRYLADDELAGRRTPSPGLEAAADYIAAGFGELGLAQVPGAPGYRQTFDCGGGSKSSNVVGLLAGKSQEPTIVVSAHYDHLGDRATGDDSIHNGANDNASGVAALLFTAQVLRKLPSPLAGSVLFIAFCGEERGLVGSKFFVAEPLIPLAQIDAVVNLEMLGRPAPGDPPLVWMTGHALSNLHEVFDRASATGTFALAAGTAVGSVEGDAFDRSDNFPFAQGGVVAHTIASGRIDSLYHSVADEADALDFARMEPIVRGVANAVIMLADGEASGTRWTEAGREAGFGPG